MKKLDLSMLPIDLKVGEEMEVLTPKGDKVTVRCVEDKRGNMCDYCFFGDSGLGFCNQVKCNIDERETKDSVSFQVVKTKRKRIKDLESGKEYKVGDVVRYFKGSLCFPKYAKFVESSTCNGCIYVGDCRNIICGDRERRDGKSVALLPCNEKGDLL